MNLHNPYAVTSGHSIGITVGVASTATLNSVLWFNNTITNITGTGVMSLSNQFTGDPVFMTDGYHLGSGSTALDRGLSAGITTDIDNETRSLTTPDLGADEAGDFGVPQLFITKTVQLGNNPIQPGDPLTYTIVMNNNGAGNAIGVVVSDTLPSYIDGPDLYQTVDITAGTSLTFTLNASLSNNVPFGEVITNTVFFSHISGSGQDSNVFSVKEEKKTYLPIILKN